MEDATVAAANVDEYVAEEALFELMSALLQYSDKMVSVDGALALLASRGF